MKQQPNRYYLYLEFPRYLAQWYGSRQYQAAHRNEECVDVYVYDTDRRAYDLDVVEMNRLHPESVLLERLLTKQERTPDLPTDDVTICIAIPEYRDKSPRIYNRLSQHSKTTFQQKIKAIFDAEIIEYMAVYKSKMTVAGSRVTTTEAIDQFMDDKNIDPEYRDSVLKAYQRANQRYYNSLYYQKKIKQRKR